MGLASAPSTQAYATWRITQPSPPSSSGAIFVCVTGGATGGARGAVGGAVVGAVPLLKETPRLEPQFNVRWKIIMKFYTATWRVRHTWLMPRRRAGLLLELPDVARLPRLLPRDGGWLTRFDM